MTGQRDGHVIVGVDIGGTKISAGVVVDDSVTEEARLATPLSGADDLIEAVRTLIVQVDPMRRAAMIGIATAGTVDQDGAIASATDLLPGWEGADVRRRIERAFEVPVSVVNDVHALAVAEARDAPERLLAVAIGTGIGGGFAVDGRLVSGPRGWAGSIGHVTVDPSSQIVCSCGARGHLEAEASGPMLERAYATATGEALSLRSIAERAHSGDREARDLIERAGRLTGTAAASGVVLLDVERIVVGGGVSEIGDLLMGAIQVGLESALPSALRGTVSVQRAAAGVRAAMIGAARHAQRTNSRPRRA